MGWGADPDLQKLFHDEVVERAARLAEGARELGDGEPSDELAGAMVREGHTIKGTGKVMGFNAISRVGETIETIWRRMQSGELSSSEPLKAALEAVADELPAAAAADPDRGTPELSTALDQLADVAHSPGEESPAPPSPEAASGGSTDRARLSHELMASAGRYGSLGSPERTSTESPSEPMHSDLGGLLGALENWASGEAVMVNAGRLYRLINHVAAIRIDTEALRGKVMDALDTADKTEAGAQVRSVAEAVTAMEVAANSLQQEALGLAAVPLSEITNAIPQLVRYLAKKTGKEIRFELVGDDLAVDRQVLEGIADPLRQLIVNAIEHGIESPAVRNSAGKAPTATLGARARIKEQQLEIEIEDDGNGIDWNAVHRTAIRRGLLPDGSQPDSEVLRSLLFAPGFSTAQQTSELVGDGTGLTAVAEAVEALYGSIRLETTPDVGTKVSITVPTSRALQRAVVVVAAGRAWGIPETAIDEILPIAEVEVATAPHRKEMVWRGQRILVASFADAVGLQDDSEASSIVVLTSQIGSVGLTVTEVVGSRDVAAKELGPLLAGPPHLTGAALLGGDDVVLLVDAGRLSERARELPPIVPPVAKVLVVDDSQGARQVVAGALASNGFEASVAGSFDEALSTIVSFRPDALVVDLSMPGADGLALVHEVRERMGDIPIVMLSGVATEEDQGRVRAAGVDAFFDKSDFREGGLADTLRSLVAARGTRPGVQA